MTLTYNDSPFSNTTMTKNEMKSVSIQQHQQCVAGGDDSANQGCPLWVVCIPVCKLQVVCDQGQWS